MSWKGLPRAHVESAVSEAETDLRWVHDQGQNTSEALHEHCGGLVGRLPFAVPVGTPSPCQNLSINHTYLLTCMRMVAWRMLNAVHTQHSRRDVKGERSRNCGRNCSHVRLCFVQARRCYC